VDCFIDSEQLKITAVPDFVGNSSCEVKCIGTTNQSKNFTISVIESINPDPVTVTQSSGKSRPRYVPSFFTTSKKEDSFELSPESIKINLLPGQGINQNILLKNNLNKKITINNARTVSDGVTITFTGKGSIGPKAFNTNLFFTNLNTTLTPLTVTSASASSNSTTLVLNDASFIQDGSSTIIKGPGIDVDETGTSITTREAGSNTITLSAAKTVEAGQTLSIEGSSSAITITGDVVLTKMGDTNFTSTLQIDDFVGIGVS